jgi:hypothetical protein
VRAAAPFSADAAVRLPWGTIRPAFEARAEPLGLPGPEAEVRSVERAGDLVRWKALVRSRRGAGEIQLAVPPSVTVRSVAVEGVPVPAPLSKLARWFGGWWVYRIASPPGGVEVELAAVAAGPLEVVLADWSSDLPPAAARVAAARPDSAVTQQEGDGTLLTRRLLIAP